MRPASSRGTVHHGFTMVELIVVLILVGIIGSIAVGRFMERSSFDSAAWTEQVRSTLRQAQKLAIAQNNPVYVYLTPQRVVVCLERDPACTAEAMRVRAPGGANSGSPATRAACASANWLCEGRPEGVTMRAPGQAATALIGGVAFDGLGRATLVDGFTGRIEIKGDGITTSIGVDPGSGYVD